MERPTPTKPATTPQGMPVAGAMLTRPSLPKRMVNVVKATAESLEKAWSPSTKMAVVLTSRQTYEGTVDQATVQARRARNKRARQARAMHRRRANR